jgi:hypothetical protein
MWEAFEVKVNDRTLGKALESPSAKGKVAKVSGTKYQVLPPGMQHADAIAGSRHSGPVDCE